jgi:hypothetical protein
MPQKQFSIVGSNRFHQALAVVRFAEVRRRVPAAKAIPARSDQRSEPYGKNPSEIGKSARLINQSLRPLTARCFTRPSVEKEAWNQSTEKFPDSILVGGLGDEFVEGQRLPPAERCTLRRGSVPGRACGVAQAIIQTQTLTNTGRP